MFADKLYIYIDSLCIVKIIRINNCGFNWLRINTSKLIKSCSISKSGKSVNSTNIQLVLPTLGLECSKPLFTVYG